MGWSGEVHARRTLEARELAKQQRAAGPYATHDMTGNSSLLSLVSVAGIVAARAVWQAEGRFLRSRDVRRIPLVGPWLAENVTRWRDNSPRRRAGRAAARREKLSQGAGQNAASASMPAASSSSSGPASVSRPEVEQQQAGTASRKQRNRKRSKRR